MRHIIEMINNVEMYFLMNKCLLIFEGLYNTTKPVDFETENTTVLCLYLISEYIY